MQMPFRCGSRFFFFGPYLRATDLLAASPTNIADRNPFCCPFSVSPGCHHLATHSVVFFNLNAPSNRSLGTGNDLMRQVKIPRLVLFFLHSSYAMTGGRAQCYCAEIRCEFNYKSQPPLAFENECGLNRRGKESVCERLSTDSMCC